MSIIQNPVVVTTSKLMDPNRNINIFYSVVTGKVQPHILYKINRDILDMVYRLKHEQIHKLLDQGYVNPKVTMDGWYEIRTNERGILSLTFGNYTMAYPAAHGLTIIKSLTFDINTGQIYSLKDLFKPESNYVKILSDIVARQIKERNIDTLGDFEGISPDQYYYVADKCLVLYFQLYDITPYAFGFPFFPVSVYEIQDIIYDDGPLGRMLAAY